MLKEKYKHIKNNEFSVQNWMKPIWYDRMFMLIYVIYIGAFFAWPTRDGNIVEKNLNSLRGSELTVDGKSSTLDSEEAQSKYIANAVNGAEDELEYMEEGEIIKASDEIFKDVTESGMISYLEGIVNKVVETIKVSGGSITGNETKSILIEIIIRLKEKELNKLSSLADMAADNGKATIEKIADEDKKEGMSNTDVVFDIDNKETEAEQDIRDVIEEEIDQIMLGIDEDAKEVMAKVIQDLLNGRDDKSISNAIKNNSGKEEKEKEDN